MNDGVIPIPSVWVLVTCDDGQFETQLFLCECAAWMHLCCEHRNIIEQDCEHGDAIMQRCAALYENDQDEIRDALGMSGIDFTIEAHGLSKALRKNLLNNFATWWQGDDDPTSEMLVNQYLELQEVSK